MTDAARIAAVVLAGGRSSRFGREKLIEPIDGRPMLEHVVQSVRQVATDIVIVVAPDRPLPVHLAPDARTVADQQAYAGPLAGLVTGLRALDASIDRVLVVGGDMPTLVPAVLFRLLRELDGHDLAVLADDDRERPLPLAVRRASGLALAERLLEGGERRLRALLTDLDHAVIAPETWRLDDPTGSTLRDVDVPGDLPG